MIVFFKNSDLLQIGDPQAKEIETESFILRLSLG